MLRLVVLLFTVAVHAQAVDSWRARLDALARPDHRDGTLGPTGARLWVTRMASLPGWRGQAHYLQHTQDFVDPLRVEFGGETPELTAETWYPSHSTLEYRIRGAGEPARVVEHRWLTTDDVLVDQYHVTGPAEFTVRVDSRYAPRPAGDLARWQPQRLQAKDRVNLLSDAALLRGAVDAPAFAEAELPLRQHGSTFQDRKAAASGGEVLGANFGTKKGHEAAWQFLSRGGAPTWSVWLRYARAAAGDARWRVSFRGAEVAVVTCASTGGWGDRAKDFRWQRVDLAEMPQGLVEVSVQADHDGANVNFDGLLLLPQGQEPPPVEQLPSFPALRGAVHVDGGTQFVEGVPFQVMPQVGPQGYRGEDIAALANGQGMAALVVDSRKGVLSLHRGSVTADMIVLAVTREPEQERIERTGRVQFHGVESEVLLSIHGLPKPTLRVPAGATHIFTVCLEVSGGRLPGMATRRACPPEVAAGHWLEAHRNEYARWYAEQCPRFQSNDPLLQNLWTYRCFLLRHNLAEPRAGHLSDGPVFFEGRHGSWYPQVITFSTPHIVAEARWLADSSLWSSNVRTHLRYQLADGELPNVICTETRFRYSNWIGAAAVEALKVRPDRGLAQSLWPGLVRNAKGVVERYDRDGDGTLAPGDHFATGMEFQPSFWFHAEYDNSKPEVDLERPDGTSYAFANAWSLAEAAKWLGKSGDQAQLSTLAERLRAASLSKLWHKEDGFFYSVRAQDDSPARTKEVIGFYPFTFALPPDQPEYLRALSALIDPAEFWTNYPVASCSAKVPVYSAAVQRWPGPGGVVAACMWNGPTWPHANSLVADAMARVLRQYHGHPLQAAQLGELLRRFAKFHMEGGDPTRPMLREYGNGDTGINWGCADYLHSTWIDLLIRHMAGIVPRFDDTLEIKPLALGLGDASFDDIPYHGHRLGVRLKGDRLEVRIDDAVVGVGSAAAGLTLAGVLR